MSTSYAGYPAYNAVDGDVYTLAATQNAQSYTQWISLQMPPGTTITRVEVYNRADGALYEDMLSPYEVWLGSSAGGETYDCGGGPLTLASPAGRGPFTTTCAGRTDLPYVTVLIRAGTLRYLTLGEVKVFGAPAPGYSAGGQRITVSPPPGLQTPPSSSPPAPAPPLSSLTRLTVQEARLSTVLSGRFYPASNAIDGNPATLCASTIAQSSDQWLSVHVSVPYGQSIGYVAIHNRADGNPYEGWLNPYELWLGSTLGGQSYQCVGQQTAGPGIGPFATWCGGSPVFDHVTLVLRAGTARYLTIGEIEVFAA